MQKVEFDPLGAHLDHCFFAERISAKSGKESGTTILVSMLLEQPSKVHSTSTSKLEANPETLLCKQREFLDELTVKKGIDYLKAKDMLKQPL